MNNAIELLTYSNFRGSHKPPFDIHLSNYLKTGVGIVVGTSQYPKTRRRATINKFVCALIKYFPQLYKAKATFKLYAL